MFSRTAFLNILEKATSHLQLEPDWNSIIAVSDCIRQGDVEPKFALNSIKKKLTGSNLHVNMFALLVLESCVKNCGPSFHAEIATKSFMEELHEIVKSNTNEKIKDKVLELIQTWAHAFRNQAAYRPVIDMCNLLKLEGFKFPHLKESDAMFSASIAPEWVDGDCCHRCRTSFSLIERKHHCRCCGQVFCNKCSSKQSIIPKFGIEKEVRVCEDCYEKLNSTSVLKTTKSNDNKSTKTSTTTVSNGNSNTTTTPGKTEEELREEEELQMAIALSQSEAEFKEKQKKRYPNNYNSFGNFENDNLNKQIDSINKEQLDPNLNLYMNRAYWEQKSLENNKRINETPSAPQQTLIKNKNQNQQQQQQINKTQNEQQQLDQFNKTTIQLLKNSDTEDDNIEQFQNNLKSTIEIFVNRMNSNKNRGRPISNDSAVQSMFLNITNMHSQLLKHIQQQDDLRSKFELLQDKLSQARDARAALDSLREEYNEKLKREAEEAELIRQQQMAFKLDMMRKKKQEYLQYQHQIALQRVQDQEREMKMRLEQQKYGVWPNQQLTINQQTPQQYQQNNTGYPIPPNHYNNYDYSQINNHNHLNYAQQNGNLTQQQINTSISQPVQHMQTPLNVLPQPQNPHLPPQQPQLPHQQPNQITQPPHIMPPNSIDHSNPQQQFTNQQHYQGVYNMQALNNSLPQTQPTNLNSTNPQQTQINPPQQYVTQTSIPESESNVNNLSAQVNKQIEEAPLISFD